MIQGTTNSLSSPMATNWDQQALFIKDHHPMLELETLLLAAPMTIMSKDQQVSPCLRDLTSNHFRPYLQHIKKNKIESN